MHWPFRRSRPTAFPVPRPVPSSQGDPVSRTQDELRAEFEALAPADQALLAEVRVGCGARSMPLQQLADLLRDVQDRLPSTTGGVPDQPRPVDS